MLDVLIVGAGPAGTVAATVLARNGARVRIVDRARFPRDKLCGDTVNPGTIALLLLTVAFGSTVMLAKEKRARANEANLRLLAQTSERKAQSAADKSQQVALLWQHLLEGLGPATPLSAQEKSSGWPPNRCAEILAVCLRRNSS